MSNYVRTYVRTYVLAQFKCIATARFERFCLKSCVVFSWSEAMSIPPPVPANTWDTISVLFDAGTFKFPEKPFWDGNDVWDVVEGTHILWQFIATGEKSGSILPQVEYFHGEVQGWENESVFIRMDVTTELQKVHYSFLVGDPEKEWCILPTGRCARSYDVWATLLKNVKCPVCDHPFYSECEYYSHYQSVHAVPIYQ